MSLQTIKKEYSFKESLRLYISHKNSDTSKSSSFYKENNIIFICKIYEGEGEDVLSFTPYEPMLNNPFRSSSYPFRTRSF